VPRAQDMSGYLQKHRYFPSFNRPYFDSIRDASGHKAAGLETGGVPGRQKDRPQRQSGTLKVNGKGRVWVASQRWAQTPAFSPVFDAEIEHSWGISLKHALAAEGDPRK